MIQGRTVGLGGVVLAAVLLAAGSGGGAETLESVAGAPVVYTVDLEGRDHHEARIEVRFQGLPAGPLEVRMSRTSPGRYALHEFAKNVYAVEAVDGKGKPLAIERPDPHQWTVPQHDGTVVFRYTLFGDLSDGTYAAIDSSHAHLNVPASFAWARGLEQRPIEVGIEVPKGWRIATQLPLVDGRLRAPNQSLFIDSPIEVSASESYSWTIGEGAAQQTVEIALHHTGKEPEARALVTLAQRVVNEAVAIFGEAPRYDFGRYTFLVDVLPWSAGDGMEHRDSTVVTTRGTLQERIDDVIGTMSHEFFHSWNVERIRPSSLEPFNLEEVNPSRELWFAEGFTNYYGELVRARSGVLDVENFADILGRTLSRVIGAPGARLYSPQDMSFQAPFVNAATANEPTNRPNTYLSYYTYGEALALALDLSLRERPGSPTLDDWMRVVWQRFGRTERHYTTADLHALLGEWLGDPAFADRFFGKSIEGHEAPDFAALLERVGLRLRRRSPGAAWLGSDTLRFSARPAGQDGDAPAAAGQGEPAEEWCGARVEGTPLVDSPLFNAGVGNGDLLLRLGGVELTNQRALDRALKANKPGERVELVFEKRGEERKVKLELAESPQLELITFEAAGEPLADDARARRAAWLAPRARPRAELRRYCPMTGEPYPYRYRRCPIHGEPLQLSPRTQGQENAPRSGS